MWVNHIYHFFCDAFRPPFRTAPWIVLFYAILSVIFNSSSYFNQGTLPDTDDYTRLMQVLNLLDGQNWYDFTLARLYPLHPIQMHWARLPDMPLAALILFFESITHFFQIEITRTSLARLAAFFVPCGLMLVLFIALKNHTRILVGRKWAGISAFILPLTMLLMFQFMPLRVDHHAYILLAASGAFFALLALALNIAQKRMAIFMAACLALGLWNGAETMPMLGMVGIALTCLFIQRGKGFGLGLIFSGSLLGFTALLLPLARPPSDIFGIAYDSFSFFYVLIAFAAFCYFLTLAAFAKFIKIRLVQSAFAIFASLSTLAIFLHVFPDFALGPYAKTNPLLGVLFFPNIREAVPFYQAWGELWFNFALNPQNAMGGALYYLTTRLFIPVVGLIACFYGLVNKKTSPRSKRLWFLYAFFCTGFTLLALFWQVRVITYAQLFAIAPFCWLLLRFLKNLQLHYAGRTLHHWEILTVLSFTIIPAIFVPAIFAGSKFMPDMLFYLGNGMAMPCKNTVPILHSLAVLEKESNKPLTLMAPMDYTPEFMLHSTSNYIAAPYHRNDKGIIDMLSFFRARPNAKNNDARARRLAQKLNLDYVVVCKKSFYQLTLDSNPESKNMQMNNITNRLEPVFTATELQNASLGVRLTHGKPPAWLQPVPIPYDDEFALFRVKK